MRRRHHELDTGDGQRERAEHRERRPSAHPARRTVDVLRRLSSSRTTRVVNSDDASAAGSSTASEGRPGSDASFVRETASALGGAGGVHRPVVARRLAFEMELSIDPPDRRMQAGERDDHSLDEARDVVAAVDVRPLVHDNLIELLIVQRAEGDRRDDDRGRRQAEHRGRPNVVRDRQPGAAAPCAKREPRRQPDFARLGKWPERAFGAAERHERGRACARATSPPTRTRRTRAARRSTPGGAEGRRSSCRRPASSPASLRRDASGRGTVSPARTNIFLSKLEAGSWELEAGSWEPEAGA